MKNLATNKQALYNYNILEKIEAGLKLSGPEVKSIKKGQVNLKGSYISVPDDSSAFLVNTHISSYKPASAIQLDYNPTHERRLLLHKKQIKNILGKSKEAGISVIPLKIYVKNKLIKIEIGIGRGKKKFDKREDIKKREFNRRQKQLLNR